MTTVILDATPLGLLTQRPGVDEADRCKRWYASITAADRRVLVPEVADYEVRRELLRAGKVRSIGRLDSFISAQQGRYVSITTAAMRLAAELWAQSRRAGLPTAPNAALDGDVILAAQALTLGLPTSDIIVVTSNVGHISRFVPAELWQNIAATSRDNSTAG